MKIRRRCSALLERARRLRAALLPRVRFGSVTFCDPVLLCGVCAFLLWRDPSGWLRLSLLASALHECGHAAVFFALTRHAPEIDVNLTGFCLRARCQGFSPRAQGLLAAAGPGANAAAAAVCAVLLRRRATVRLLGFYWANLLVGGCNLLPVPPLDGWQLASLLWEWKLHFRRG